MDCFNNSESCDAHRSVAIRVKWFYANKRERGEPGDGGRGCFAAFERARQPLLRERGNQTVISLTRIFALAKNETLSMHAQKNLH